MKTSKMYERIKWYKKEYVHDNYSRIIIKFKNYDKITSVKMIEAIYNEYSDYHNIIDICTVRELKYLKLLLDKKMDKKYQWERNILDSKFLIQTDYPDNVFIPDEIIDKVKEAIKNVNWEKAKKLDSINEILVPFCKIQASCLLDVVCTVGMSMTGINKEDLIKHIFNNKLFRYYVMVYSKEIEGLNQKMYVALYQDYYAIEDSIDIERKNKGLVGDLKIDPKLYKTLFYNDFDINNKKIKKMLDDLKELPFIWITTIQAIREYAVLNLDRTSLKEAIANIPSLKKIDLTDFFKTLDEAMDEMPSGSLNGLTPNEAKQVKLEEQEREKEKDRIYIKQNNACLSKKDAKLFYKIYFALIEFTNNKYNIKPKFKLYKKTGINPYDITEIIDTFWKNKETVVLEFCLSNPYKFNTEELKITSEFKKGIYDLFIICKFYEEYTALMNETNTYMIKGINDNLDNIISYKDLPIPTFTAVIPFKNVLIYDGILRNMPINFGNSFGKTMENELEKSIKYYHL